MFEVVDAVKQGQVLAGVVTAPLASVDRIAELKLICQWLKSVNDPGNRPLPLFEISHPLAVLENIDE